MEILLQGANLKVGIISAPTLLWGVCIAIVVFAIWQICRLCGDVRRLKNRFYGLTKKLRAIPPVDKAIDPIGLEPFREVMQQDQTLREPWDEFEETLLFIKNETSGTETVHNTRQADEFFKEDAIIGPNINLRWYASLPGIFTSIGLASTFIAILLGLASVHVNNGDVAGIDGLVNNLSGKFITSIAALLSAVIFTIIEKRLVNNIHQAYQGFIEIFNCRFARMPAERLLQDIRHDIQQQSIAFRQFGTDLSGHLKESLREGMGPMTQRLVEAIEKLELQKSESMETAVGGMLDEFKSKLMGSTSSEFQSLAGTLAQTVALLEQMNQAGQKSQAQTAEMIATFDHLIKRQSAAGEETLSALSNTLEGILIKLHDASATSATSLSQSMATVLERIEQATTNQLNVNAQRTEALMALTQQTVREMQEMLAHSSTTVESTVSGLIDRSSTTSQQTAESMALVIAEQNKTVEAIGAARTHLTEALNTFRDSVQHGADTLRQIENGSKSVSDGLTTIHLVTSKMATIQEYLQALSASIEGNTKSLTQGMHQVTDRLSRTVSEAERAFGELDKSIGGVLRQVNSNLENYSASVKSHLEKTIAQFDATLTNATKKLGGTVQALEENLENIVELAQRAKAVENG